MSVIQLVPKNSRRILLSELDPYRKDGDGSPEYSSIFPYIIDSDEKMQKFISDFNKVISFPWGEEGVVDWEKLKESYSSIEFLWYKDFWNCSESLQNSIEINHCWEWYANIEEPCIYTW